MKGTSITNETLCLLISSENSHATIAAVTAAKASEKKGVTNPPTELFDPPSSSVSGSCGIKSWILAGLSPKNMVLGMPFYGYAWKLVNANNHGFKAPSSGPVGSGDGVVSEYCYSGTTWVGYDDIQSITAKVSYAKQHGLLGYFAWHVGVDNNWALSQQGLGS
ncbi:unnamed protein product [Camellia sinensis]